MMKWNFSSRTTRTVTVLDLSRGHRVTLKSRMFCLHLKIIVLDGKTQVEGPQYPSQVCPSSLLDTRHGSVNTVQIGLNRTLNQIVAKYWFCEECEKWNHPSCLSLSESVEPEQFICRFCEEVTTNTILKPKVMDGFSEPEIDVCQISEYLKSIIECQKKNVNSRNMRDIINL